jgi:CubicO group peptidase (beta-lactamase class C family)
LDFSKIKGALDDAVERGVFPGATLIVRLGEDVLYEHAAGFRSLTPERKPMRMDTVFDLSSLTKPLATTVAVMMLTRDGKLKLEDRLSRFFPNFGVHGKGQITLRHLLAHCSGLPAWKPFYQQIAQIEKNGKVNFMANSGAREYVYEQIHREKPQSPPGTVTVYSDLNFILLGELVEQVSGVNLARFCRDKIFRRLGLRATDFIDISLVRSRGLEPVVEMIAPTEICPLRGRLLAGEAHDENAYAMGGVAGHAGLFASVADVDRIARELLACYHGRSDLIAKKIVAQFWQRDDTVKDSTWALGWDTPSTQNSSAGRFFSPRAVGHLGFTGTSIWIEPQREIAVSLLTNRVHPKRDNEAIREFRPVIHDLIMETINDAFPS